MVILSYTTDVREIGRAQNRLMDLAGRLLKIAHQQHDLEFIIF